MESVKHANYSPQNPGREIASKIISALIDSKDSLWIDAPFKTILENIPVFIYVYSKDKVLYINPLYSVKMGYSLDEMQRKKFWDIVHPDDRELVKERGLARLRNEDVPTDYEFRIITKFGDVLWVHVYFAMTQIEDENIGVIGAIDLTESKKLKEELKEAHNLVSHLSGSRAYFHFKDILTNDPVMLSLIESGKFIASSISNVLIVGESGTGKELFAQSIHNESPWSSGPFLAVNCGAIPRDLISSELFGYADGAFTGARKGGNPGKFELANGGTLFLDEIGDMSLEQQATVLRAIQDKVITRIGGREVIPVNVRIICATNKDLFAEMNEGTFRRDLYYRLNVINLKIPPLRERPSDIKFLFDHFLKTMGAALHKKITAVSDEVIEDLNNYDWPGNVRELQNVAERMINIVQGSTLSIEHLPMEIRRYSSSTQVATAPVTPIGNNRITLKEARDASRKMMADAERKEIMMLLEKHKGNIKQVAVEMGISRTTLYKKLRTYLS